MNRANNKTQKNGYLSRLWVVLLLALDLVSMEKRISEKAKATKHIGEKALLAVGAAAGLAGMVSAVRLKRKIWPNSPKSVPTPNKKTGR